MIVYDVEVNSNLDYFPFPSLVFQIPALSFLTTARMKLDTWL